MAGRRRAGGGQGRARSRPEPGSGKTGEMQLTDVADTESPSTQNPAINPFETRPLNPGHALHNQTDRQASLRCSQSATGCHGKKKGMRPSPIPPRALQLMIFPFGYADILFGHLATARC